jgi:GNAT superfamily N-acetyltransferase
MHLLRPAALADVRAIAEVHVASWQAAYRGLLPDPVLAKLEVEPREQMFRQVLTAPRTPGMALWVGESQGRIDGFVAFGPERDRGEEALGEIYALYADRRAWGTGLGTALLAQACDQLRRSGCSEAVLWVLDSNRRARGFYERRGWRADGGRKAEMQEGLLLQEVRYRVRLGPRAAPRID